MSGTKNERYRESQLHKLQPNTKKDKKVDLHRKKKPKESQTKIL